MAAIDMLDSFLEQKHCTLWGIKKDIVDPKGRREAAAWLKRTIEDFYEFNSGVRIQIKDDSLDVDVAHLQAEYAAACDEIKRLQSFIRWMDHDDGRIARLLPTGNQHADEAVRLALRENDR